MEFIQEEEELIKIIRGQKKEFGVVYLELHYQDSKLVFVGLRETFETKKIALTNTSPSGKP